MQRKWCRVWLVSAVILSAGPLGFAAPELPKPKPIPIWPEGTAGAPGRDQGDTPTLVPYETGGDRPPPAIIICSDGSYDAEQVARWLNARLISAFVLNHRQKQYPAPLEDLQRAIRLLRSAGLSARGDQRGNLKLPGIGTISQNQIGVMGFGAGGHLASMAAVHFDLGKPDAADPVERFSSRPDLVILFDPVITIRPPHGNARLVKHLVGENPTPELLSFYSTDERVRAETPPTFIISSWRQEDVPAENSLRFAMALRQAKVPCELHIYERDEREPPGWLSREDTWQRILDSRWERLSDWLRVHSFTGYPIDKRVAPPKRDSSRPRR